VFGEREGLQGKIIRKIVCDTNSKNLWLATNKGVVLVELGNTLDSGNIHPPRFTIIKGLEGEAQSVFVDSERCLWALLPTRGVFVKAKTDDSAKPLASFPNLPFSSPRQIMETPDGTIWIGTQDKGLFFYQKGVLRKFTNDDNSNKVRLERFVYGLFTDSRGTLWIGDAEVFSRFSGGKLDTLANNQWLKAVQSVIEDKEGNLWIGSYFHGLTRIRNGKFLSYSTSEGLPSATVHCISQDADSTLWIGTEQGIALLSAGTIRTDATVNKSLPSTSVRHICRARDGSFWIATTGGVLHVARRISDGRNAT
jgi:ligand-binding sensor domain-containing protein